MREQDPATASLCWLAGCTPEESRSLIREHQGTDVTLYRLAYAYGHWEQRAAIAARAVLHRVLASSHMPGQ